MCANDVQQSFTATFNPLSFSVEFIVHRALYKAAVQVLVLSALVSHKPFTLVLCSETGQRETTSHRSLRAEKSTMGR